MIQKKYKFLRNLIKFKMINSNYLSYNKEKMFKLRIIKVKYKTPNYLIQISFFLKIVKLFKSIISFTLVQIMLTFYEI